MANLGVSRGLRRCLLASAGALLMFGCGGGDDDTSDASTTTSSEAAEVADGDDDADESTTTTVAPDEPDDDSSSDDEGEGDDGAGQAEQPQAGPLSSSFDGDAEGWRVEGDGDDLTHFATGGNPDGYIGTSDLSQGVTWFFATPQAWAGDRSEFTGGTLRYDLVIDSTDRPHLDDDVVLLGAGRRLGFRHGTRPTTEWATYHVPLVDGAWTDLDSGATATAGSVGEVLGDLAEIWIRGEYREGPDVASLDNVAVTAEIPPPLIDPTGTWSSDYGNVTLEGTDGVFAGPYGNDGFVAGRMGALTLIGYWFSDTATVTCDEPRDDFDHWGRIVWVFDRANTEFEGLWGYCDDEPDEAWNGTRLSDDAEVLAAETTPDSQRQADPPLVTAAAQGDLESVNAQLADGADPNIARDRDGWTPLLFAAQDGYTDIVDSLLAAGAAVDRGTDDNWTALMIASQNGHEDTVAALLAGGANPRVGRSSNWTALHSAVLRNRPGVVTQLIDAGAPLEAAERGFTPLAIAAQEGVDAVITLLLDAGANVDGNPVAGPTPLYMAVQNGYPTSVELLLGGGADPSDGGTSDPPMVTVGARDRNAMAALLVDAGADIDQQRSDGFTALHWAAYRNNPELVRILLDLGADASVTDNNDETPLDVAIRRESSEAAAALG